MKNYRWSNEQIRNQVNVLDEVINPHIILKNATYLNKYLNQWLYANIWIYQDRIIYVGENLPENLEGIEVVNCEGQFLVPGYIEPHSHPYQLYNPLTLAKYAGQFGTTTLINDNLKFFLEMSTNTAFELLNDFTNIPSSMYWWCRFDGQTEFPNNDEIFNSKDVISWLENELVLQGGELTAWPKLLNGDNQMLTWIQETKKLNKKVEGHFPGASERTLAKLSLLGADCDHEAMTGKEVLMRLMQGYTVSLRYSSIRPDLEVLLKEIKELGIQNYERFFFTTDGSHPYFYEQGMTDELIKIAIRHEVPLIDAYKMASYNVAQYYNMEHLHGSIATGRIANINLLENIENPTPTSVLAKGKWIKKEGKQIDHYLSIDWGKYQFTKLELKWSLQKEDLSLSNTYGINLINNVITKPYESVVDKDCDELSYEHDECFLLIVGRDGTWRLNTLVKGFAGHIRGFASSYSGTGDILILGKRKSDMLKAFERMKEIGGGLVLVEDNEVLHEVSLPLRGSMSELEMENLIKVEKKMIQLLKERGYKYDDPAFTLLFFSATHLPFIRLTPSGLYDVKNKKVLVSPVKRETPEKII
ncbi:adenine deaminase C-terminal domain-containing protein [Bacillus sp. AFS041924]|uniref:adenine deaminase C-terminal domain-containing protein n=1 Tax=Bacillus sp. AFS041924 TaxID=2033503 RepID=UPI000BFCA968|nr:adenine deaminase C-terminal domain-containing protein [Bacillus sp. AFS041924]PGS53969.1 adenosine deaminase [Bacillus sp. AFS041924]